MSERDYLSKDLEKILERLSELLPRPAPQTDWDASMAFRWRASAAAATRDSAAQAGCSRCSTCTASGSSDLRGIDKQIERVEQNTRQFLDGKPANNVLLTGARGTGKSSIVKGLLNKYARQGLRLIEVEKNDLVDLPYIVDLVARAQGALPPLLRRSHFPRRRGRLHRAQGGARRLDLHHLREHA